MTLEEYQDIEIDKLFLRLEHSKFRSRFHLTEKDKKYILEKGMDVISSHAYDFISKRLAPANLVNDGKQTPMKGHPVFVAQHATATCCRGCLYKWHHISKDKDLTKEQVDYVVHVIMRWIKKRGDKMTLKDEFKYLVGGYYGIMEMDEYDLKVYVLKDIENYIRAFIEENPIPNFDYKKEAENIKDTMSLRTKLQDSLLILYKIDASMDLVFMVKARLKQLDKEKNAS